MDLVLDLYACLINQTLLNEFNQKNFAQLRQIQRLEELVQLFLRVQNPLILLTGYTYTYFIYRLCNMDIISHVQQVICFAFHDSKLLMETCQEAKNLRKIVTLFYLDQQNLFMSNVFFCHDGQGEHAASGKDDVAYGGWVRRRQIC